MDQTTGQNPSNPTASSPTDATATTGNVYGSANGTDHANVYGYVPPVTAPEPPVQERPKFRLRRSSTDRMLGGVCGGLAESLDVDASLLRIGLVVLTVIGVGATIPIYLAVWLLAPET